MNFQAVFSSKFLATIRTYEWFFTSPNVSSDVYSCWSFEKTFCHIQGKRTVFHQCEFYYALSNGFFVWTSFHKQYMQMVFLQCVVYYALSNLPFVWKLPFTNRTCKWFFSSVNSSMHFNAVFSLKFLVTIRTCKQFFTSMYCSMFTQVVLSRNVLSQSGQANGFSPVLIPWWLFKSSVCFFIRVTCGAGERLITSVSSSRQINFYEVLGTSIKCLAMPFQMIFQKDLCRSIFHRTRYTRNAFQQFDPVNHAGWWDWRQSSPLHCVSEHFWQWEAG